jgi:hypothetical protein
MRTMSVKQIRSAIAARAEFEAGGIIGTTFAPFETGRLTEREVETYIRDHSRGISYVIVNHGTPIAWVRGIGQVFIPNSITRKQADLVRSLNI